MGAIHQTAEHRALKEQLRPDVDAGRAWCTELVCVLADRWIQPGTDWDLAHDRASGGYLGPAHARCNRAEGARYGNRLRGLRRHGLAAASATSTERSWSSRRW